jgi:pimeloyl-ACP methyl ester carboxylesterase
MAGAALSRVYCPTLLIVGGHDEEVVSLNRTALEHLGGEKQLSVIPGATHLFEEPGTLDEAARLAAEWFARHLHPKGRS